MWVRVFRGSFLPQRLHERLTNHGMHRIHGNEDLDRFLFCVVRVFRGSLLSSEQLLPQSPGLYSIAETTKLTARSFILCGFSRSARLPSTSTAFADTPYKKWQPSSRQWISYSFQGWVQEEVHKEPHNPSQIPAKGFRTSKAVNYFVPQQGASAKA